MRVFCLVVDIKESLVGEIGRDVCNWDASLVRVVKVIAFCGLKKEGFNAGDDGGGWFIVFAVVLDIIVPRIVCLWLGVVTCRARITVNVVVHGRRTSKSTATLEEGDRTGRSEFGVFWRPKNASVAVFAPNAPPNGPRPFSKAGPLLGTLICHIIFIPTCTPPAGRFADRQWPAFGVLLCPLTFIRHLFEVEKIESLGQQPN
jgi:hypothetical protein